MNAASMQYQGRTFTVEPTGNTAEPYKLVGARGSVLALVARATTRPTFWVRLPSGKIQGGYVGQLSDGSLLHLPTWGQDAGAARARWTADGMGGM